MTRPLRVPLLIASLTALLAPSPALAQTKRIRPADERAVFRCKRLIDPGSGRILDDAAIAVGGGRILAVHPATEIASASGARVVDFGEKFVIPGLVELHGHLYGGRNSTQPFAPALFLAAGVTSVQAPGSGDPEGDIAMRNRVNAGRVLGPRFFLSGEYLDMAPSAVSWIEPVTTPEEARRLVEHWVTRGATSIKVYASMKGEILRAAVQHAHEHGVKVVAHVGAVTWREAIEMGVDELFHGPMAFPEVHGGTIAPVNTLEAYKALNERSARADLSSAAVAGVLRSAAEARVVLTPTVVTAEAPDLAKHRLEDQKKFWSAAGWAGLEKRLATPPDPLGGQLLDKQLEFVRRAHAAGCLLGTGTDLTPLNILPGFSLWREMELFAAAGLPSMEVLRAATANGAYALGRGDSLGAVRPGYLADFVVLDADPLADISNVRRVHRVVKGGVVYAPEELTKRWLGKVE